MIMPTTSTHRNYLFTVSRLSFCLFSADPLVVGQVAVNYSGYFLINVRKFKLIVVSKYVTAKITRITS